MHDVFESKFAHDIFKQRYAINKEETWGGCCERVVESVCEQRLDRETKDTIRKLMHDRVFIPGGRYLASAGKPLHQICNCFALRAEDSREGWADLLYKLTMMLSTGGGVGIDYSAIRESGKRITKTGGIASGPLSLIKMCNEVGRHIRSGGNRRSALFGGLNWKHKDIFDFIDLKSSTEDLIDGTNISVIFDSDFFHAIKAKRHPLHEHAQAVWNATCIRAFSIGDPGFSFDWLKDSYSLRNACSEYITDEDSDSCNLGTLFLNRIENKEHLQHAIHYAVKFLICGGIYTGVPTQLVRDLRDKNNRIGLGLGGIHEWLIKNGHQYGVPSELHKLLSVWARESDDAAYTASKDIGVAIPKNSRAIAPNGTISILAGTTGGAEPIFCKAYKRSYYENETLMYQYVVDPTADRLMNSGIKEADIEDSYDISFKRRVKFQADLQTYCDMGISSTCNLPAWGSEVNNKETLKENSKVLLSYAKRLRGFTVYPDGARDNQPLQRVTVKTAAKKKNVAIEAKENNCKDGVCGI